METVTVINFRKNGFINIEPNLFTELRMKNIDFYSTFPHSLSPLYVKMFVIVHDAAGGFFVLRPFESNLSNIVDNPKFIWSSKKKCSYLNTGPT